MSRAETYNERTDVLQLDITLLFSSSDESCSADRGRNNETNTTPKTKKTPVIVLGRNETSEDQPRKEERERGANGRNEPEPNSTSFPVLKSFSSRGETCLDGDERDGSDLNWCKRGREAEVSEEGTKGGREEKGRKERTSDVEDRPCHAAHFFGQGLDER